MDHHPADAAVGGPVMQAAGPVMQAAHRACVIFGVLVLPIVCRTANLSTLVLVLFIYKCGGQGRLSQAWEPLVQRGDDFHFGILAWEAYNKGNDHFLIGVTVRDMYPGLTREEALIGIRSIDSFRAPVRLSCMKSVCQ